MKPEVNREDKCGRSETAAFRETKSSEEPTLVIMAAGLGSRFGGLKQITPIDDDGHIIIDFSLYDAKKAGFKNIVCIINPKNESDFDSHFKNLGITYAYQTIDKLPPGFSVPEGRVKPWGTAHAILCAKDKISGSFAVINADDFYGYGSFKLVYDFLVQNTDERKYAVVGYKVENTISESGSVTRGVLKVEGSKMVHIEEMSDICSEVNRKDKCGRSEAAAFREAKSSEGDGVVYIKDGKTVELPPGTQVSMNMWGFKYGLLDEIQNRFEPFLLQNIKENPLKCEFLLPTVVGDILKDGKVEVEVLPSVEKWYGVTYANDMPGVKAAIEEMKKTGEYPQKLWG